MPRVVYSNEIYESDRELRELYSILNFFNMCITNYTGLILSMDLFSFNLLRILNLTTVRQSNNNNFHNFIKTRILLTDM